MVFRKKSISLFLAAAMALSTANFTYAASSGLEVTVSSDGAQLVEHLLWGGMQISNVQFSGANGSAGFFTGGDGIIGFDEGIVLSSGQIANVIGPNSSGSISTDNDRPGDVDLDAIVDGDTEDAVVLEFDFVPEADLMTFEYVFASDEYNEFVGSPFNDVFAFFVNGNTAAHNVAIIPNTSTPVSINTVNNGNGSTPASNPSFYRDNESGSLNTEMDGLTTVLPIRASVNPGVVNHIKLVIADRGDSIYDSAVFIKAKSLTAVEPKPGTLQFKQKNFTVDENVAGGYATIEVIRTGGSDGELEGYYGTYQESTPDAATSGIDYTEISSFEPIIFADGETSKTFQVQIIDDNLMEGDEILALVLRADRIGELPPYDLAHLTIIDNEKPPQIQFSAESYSAAEYAEGYAPNGNIAKIGVRLTGNIDDLLAEENVELMYTVDYATGDGTALADLDYRTTSGMITFDYSEMAEGIREKTFDVIILDDTLYEGTETVTLSLSNVTGGIELGTLRNAVLNIIDNETPPVSSGGGGGGASATNKAKPEEVKETAPAIENLPANTLVNRMPGYITLGTPVMMSEVKSEIILQYEADKLTGKTQYKPRIYYWHAKEAKWVALATYSADQGKVKAINEGPYTGWFAVFGVKQPTFTDISGHWAEQVFNRMNGLQMIEGYPIKGQDSLLREIKPEQSVTRAEFTIFVCRILNINPHNPRLKYADESQANTILTAKYSDSDKIPDWAKQSIATAAQADLLPFTGEKFDADKPITRAEAAVMLSRSLSKLKDFKTANLDSFKDADQISADMKAEILEGVIEGYPDGTIRPNNNLKRAEALAMIHRLFVKGMGW